MTGRHSFTLQTSTRRWLAAAVVLLAAQLCGCAGHSFVDAPSGNQNGRIRYLVIHFTTEDFATSLKLLTEPSGNPVSAHYLVPEPGDDSYPGRSLRVHRLVPEAQRAWHAGKSYWNEEESLNDHSIGIELVNRAYCSATPAAVPESDRLCFFPDYAEDQLALLFELVADIVRRNPDIDPTGIVGHADIAPDRKVDPGPRFPWQRLYRLGYGAWYDDATVQSWWLGLRESLAPLEVLQQALSEYGYRVNATGLADEQSRAAVRAFQMHFRPTGTSGDFDAESAAVLFALLEKYYPQRLDKVMKRWAAISAGEASDPVPEGPAPVPLR